MRTVFVTAILCAVTRISSIHMKRVVTTSRVIPFVEGFVLTEHAGVDVDVRVHLLFERFRI